MWHANKACVTKVGIKLLVGRSSHSGAWNTSARTCREKPAPSLGQTSPITICRPTSRLRMLRSCGLLYRRWSLFPVQHIHWELLSSLPST